MTESSKPQRTRISAYAILIKDERILLCRCSAPVDMAEEWTLPGGGIDFGEDPADAAVREVKEETGFEVKLGELLAVDSLHVRRTAADFHAIRIIYAATIIGGEMTTEINGSTDLCAWIPLADVGAYPLVDLAHVGVRLARERIEVL